MKKILFFTIIIITMFTVSGCEKEMKSYEGTRGIYFSVRWGDQFSESKWPYWSYSNFDFVQIPKDTCTVAVKVMITDNAVSYDRKFNYQIDPETTTAIEGVDYEKPVGEGVIPASQVEGYATVLLHRTAEMETEVVKLALQLIPNENFALAFTRFIQISDYNGSSEEIEKEFDASKHQLRIKDVLVKPSCWLGGFYQYGNYEEFNAFGAFTPKKIKLMFEMFDLTYADFMDATIMTTGYMNVIGRRLSIHLTEQYRKGTPIQENDGRLMWASDCKWKSYENVPWDGIINPEYF